MRVLRGLFLLSWTSTVLCGVIGYFELVDDHSTLGLTTVISAMVAAASRMYDILDGHKPILGRFSLWLVRIYCAYLVIAYIILIMAHGWPSGSNYILLSLQTIFFLLFPEIQLKAFYPKRSSGQKWSVKIREWVVWCRDIILKRFGHSLARGVAAIFAITGLINVLDRADLALLSFLIAAVIYVGDQITTAIRESKGGDESKEGDESEGGND